MNKQCQKCMGHKPFEDFHIDKSQENGRKIYCKLCCSELNKLQYSKNREIQLERSREYRESHRNDPAYIQKRREENQTYRLENKERIKRRKEVNKDILLARRRELRKLRHETQPEFFLWEASKCRAKKRELEHTLKLSDIQVPMVCPVLGIPLKVGMGEQSPNSPSIDRIDNNKGYTPENILIVSWRANDLKGNATIEELEKIVNFYKTL
jgi:hypothetical protein